MTISRNMEKIKTEKRVYKVSELTRYIRTVLEETFSHVWVEGEISNFVKHTSGHMYFSLKDEQSVISSVFFKNVNQNLKFKMEDGLHVVCFGRIGVYDKRGQYQLYVERVEPKGLGALQLAFEQLKDKLRKEGLFDEARKEKIPYLPYRIGIITSPTGAAIRDILKVTRQRFQNVDLVIDPVRVQGKGSELEIAQAIKDLNRFDDIDVIIVGRGGGSLEDLWAFNEEIVARAIFDSRIPIVSAVGHEVDWTIADFVADLRAPTPSAAAERVIPKKEDLKKSIENALARLKNALLAKISTKETNLRQLKESYVFRQPLNIVQQYQQRVDDLAKGMRLRMGHIIEMSRSASSSIIGKLNSLNPFAVLERGYSITMKLPGNRVVKDVRSVKKGDRFRTRLSKGEFISKVERIEGGDKHGRD